MSKNVSIQGRRKLKGSRVSRRYNTKRQSTTLPENFALSRRLCAPHKREQLRTFIVFGQRLSRQRGARRRVFCRHSGSESSTRLPSLHEHVVAHESMLQPICLEGHLGLPSSGYFRSRRSRIHLWSIARSRPSDRRYPLDLCIRYIFICPVEDIHTSML